MIHAICLNPTIDRYYYIDDYLQGKQYKGLVPHMCAGGKGINVAKACASMEVPVVLYGFVGRENSAQILDELTQAGIPQQLLPVPGYTRTSINIIDNRNCRETELLELGPYVAQEAGQRLMQLLTGRLAPGDLVICSGLSAPGIPEDFYVQISQACRQAQAKCLLDTNGQNLKDSVAGQYYMLKPNQQELCELCGAAPTHDLAVLRTLAQGLMAHTQWVLVSMGKRGGLLVGKELCCLAQVPKVAVKATIGCGDSAMAGFAMAVQRGDSPEDALRFALACGTANALTEGAGCLNKADVARLMNEIRVSRLA